MGKPIKINPTGIKQVKKELEREFAKNPIRVPIETDSSTAAVPLAAAVTNYTGPVIQVQGDHAQIAWNSSNVTQTQKTNTKQAITPGYEQVADICTRFLAQLPNFSLSPENTTHAQDASDEILCEVVKPYVVPQAYGASSVIVERQRLHQLAPRITEKVSAHLGEGWTVALYTIVAIDGVAPLEYNWPQVMEYRSIPGAIELHKRSFSRIQVTDLAMTLEQVFPYASLGEEPT